LTPGWNRAVGSLFWLAAVACPLDLLQYVPGLGVSLLSIIALLLVPALILDAFHHQKLRIPFEILAPALLVLAIVGVASFRHGPSDTLGEIVSAVALLLAVTHFAPARELIRRYVLAFMLSGLAVTLLTLVSRFTQSMPTAFNDRSGVTLAFAYTVPSGIHLLLLTAVAALYVSRERRFRPIERAMATGALVFVACALVGAILQWVLDTSSWPLAPYPRWSLWQFAAAGVTLWLVARIVGKIFIDAKTARDPLHGLWLAAAAVTVAACACAPVPPGAYQGYLAGLACATVLPSRLLVKPTRRTLSLVGLPILLAVTNLLLVSPGNTRDHRQYDAASQRDFEARRFESLLARLDTIDEHAPSERRSHLWRARVALAVGKPNWASFAYARAVAPPTGPALLPPPTEPERNEFVVQMRDAVATMLPTESACAFERTLLAEGDRDAALYSLRLETAVALTHVESVDSAPFAGALECILGDPSTAEDLESWSPEELVTVVAYWGATIDQSTTRPLVVLAAQRTLAGLEVYVFAHGRAERIHRKWPGPRADELRAVTTAGRFRWAPLTLGPDAEEYELDLERDDIVQRVGGLRIRADGSVVFDLAEKLPEIPFTPAVYLRLVQ
jgi:hypothetical protein